ncbi:hypothetical protein CC86DRAFT_206654 [Ophiobolus disseminans]|uniref:Uncharacterized protein n=1 Tax=Ophiobolus disseminans TaxID=1469910 RepID=A0A6A7A5Z9_9PLEO|nr:hypothetical protein CC86DRAFT_206654 [Ophiobolus disseminans]
MRRFSWSGSRSGPTPRSMSFRLLLQSMTILTDSQGRGLLQLPRYTSVKQVEPISHCSRFLPRSAHRIGRMRSRSRSLSFTSWHDTGINVALTPRSRLFTKPRTNPTASKQLTCAYNVAA